MKSSADIAANHALKQGFQLGELRVDPLEDEVSGPGGCERLDPKVMDVLMLLAQHAGHVVLREDLLAQLWPNTVVTDDALSRCIYELRKHLNQAGGDESYKAMLETQPKRGYRLNGEIVPARKPAGSDSGFWPRWRVAALAAAILIAALLWFTMR
jgi:DNA-binding winged helix-turn-helix (wHTH) protein